MVEGSGTQFREISCFSAGSLQELSSPEIYISPCNHTVNYPVELATTENSVYGSSLLERHRCFHALQMGVPLYTMLLSVFCLLPLAGSLVEIQAPSAEKENPENARKTRGKRDRGGKRAESREYARNSPKLSGKRGKRGKKNRHRSRCFATNAFHCCDHEAPAAGELVRCWSKRKQRKYLR